MAIEAKKRTAIKLALVALAMFGFGFALVPLYELVCEVTGIGGKTGRIEAASGKIDRARTVVVELAALPSSGLPWDFEPMQKRVAVHPGETTTVKYRVRSRANETLTGQAVPNVVPFTASKYFNKIECFCFTQQKLAAHETREMPVTFVVDPKLAQDVKTVTLSYTFFNTDKVSAQRYGGEASVDAGAHVHHPSHAAGTGS